MGAGTVVSEQAGHNLIFFKYLLCDNITICLTLTVFSFCLKKHRERKYQLLPLTSTYPFQPHMHYYMANILSTVAHKKLQERRQNFSLDENNSNHKFILQYTKTRIPCFSFIK